MAVESHIPTRWRGSAEGPAESTHCQEASLHPPVSTSLERRRHPSLCPLIMKRASRKMKTLGKLVSWLVLKRGTEKPNPRKSGGDMDMDIKRISRSWTGMLGQGFIFLSIFLLGCCGFSSFSFSLSPCPVCVFETGSRSVAQAIPEVTVSQAQCSPASCCGHRCETPCLASGNQAGRFRLLAAL